MGAAGASLLQHDLVLTISLLHLIYLLLQGFNFCRYQAQLVAHLGATFAVSLALLALNLCLSPKFGVLIQLCLKVLADYRSQLILVLANLREKTNNLGNQILDVRVAHRCRIYFLLVVARLFTPRGRLLVRRRARTSARRPSFARASTVLGGSPLV